MSRPPKREDSSLGGVLEAEPVYASLEIALPNLTLPYTASPTILTRSVPDAGVSLSHSPMLVILGLILPSQPPFETPVEDKKLAPPGRPNVFQYTGRSRQSRKFPKKRAILRLARLSGDSINTQSKCSRLKDVSRVNAKVMWLFLYWFQRACGATGSTGPLQHICLVRTVQKQVMPVSVRPSAGA